MCLAMPSRIVAIQGATATVDVLGARRKASLMLLPEAAGVGDYVLVHAGFALQKVEKERIDSGEAMHEAGIARSILEIVETQCRENDCAAVKSVTVKLGRAAGVMPDSLRFAFDSLKEETSAKDAALVIEEVPIGGSCHACGRDIESPDARRIFICPHCGSDRVEITRGREMEVAEMEIE